MPEGLHVLQEDLHVLHDLLDDATFVVEGFVDGGFVEGTFVTDFEQEHDLDELLDLQCFEEQQCFEDEATFVEVALVVGGFVEGGQRDDDALELDLQQVVVVLHVEGLYLQQ